MKCPVCSGRLDIKDSRPTVVEGLATVRRRRHCRECKGRLTTYEIVDGRELFLQVLSMAGEVAQLNSMMQAMVRYVQAAGKR
jgi:transcriptional regulator NrdR family protein